MLGANDGIVQGEADLADIMFLVAIVLFFVGAVAAMIRQPVTAVVVAFGLAFVAFGLLLL